MGFTGFKDEQRLRTELAFVSVGPCKHAPPFDDHDVEWEIRHLMFPNLLARFEHPAQDTAVLIDQQGLRKRYRIMKFEIVQKLFGFHFGFLSADFDREKLLPALPNTALS